MLKADYTPVFTPLDQVIFDQLAPEDHYLRRLKEAIDFSRFHSILAECYSATLGRGACDPVLLLKLDLLQFHYGWSDEAVIQHAQVNIAIRFFLDLPLNASLPDPSLLTIFRKRLRENEGGQKVFDEVLRQARGFGLVKDRARLKDATHVIANIAVPTTLKLVAQTREQLLNAAEPFAAAEVAQHRKEAEEIRTATVDLKDELRLLRRVEHLQALISWAETWLARLDIGAPPVSPEVYQAFATALELARKVFGDREPKAGDQVRSVTDPEARRAKHGSYYDGYKADVSMDPESELICAIDVLAANADEAANAKVLIESEEATHSNDIESLSMDAIGYNGAVLKELCDDPDGPQLTVYTPPKGQEPRYPDLFQSDDFTLNEAGDELTCPQGETTKTRYRDGLNHGSVFHYRASQCRDCPLRAQCIPASNSRARKVSKNDFQKQYQDAQQRATTTAYKQMRKEHPAVERKLNELVRWHSGRRSRYRGRSRVKLQFLLLAVVVNCKRIVRLLNAAPTAQPA